MCRSIQNQITLILFLLIVIPGTTRAIDDRVLVLPPSIHSRSDEAGIGRMWNRSVTLYREAVMQSAPISEADQLAKWTGDTLQIDFFDLDAAREWGERFEADVVVLQEWTQNPGGTGYSVSLQRLDLWAGELRGPVEQPSLELAVAVLEPTRFVFDTEYTPVDQLLIDAGLPESAYTPPTFVGGLDAVHDYAHKSRSYPPDALIQGIVGTADVRVTLSIEGVPVSVKLLRVSPPNMEFEAAFEKALWAVKYKPATWQGVTVNGVLATRIRMTPVP